MIHSLKHFSIAFLLAQLPLLTVGMILSGLSHWTNRFISKKLLCSLYGTPVKKQNKTRQDVITSKPEDNPRFLFRSQGKKENSSVFFPPIYPLRKIQLSEYRGGLVWGENLSWSQMSKSMGRSIGQATGQSLTKRDHMLNKGQPQAQTSLLSGGRGRFQMLKH